MVDLFDFFEQLSLNNDRPWFQQHKSEYDQLRQEWIAHIDRIIALLAPEWPELTRHTGASVTYRVYRDVRFSADKTPYKTHISSSISPYGRNLRYAGIYLQAGLPDCYNGIFAGLWAPSPAVLRKVRAAILDNIEEWEAIVRDPALTRVFPGWDGARLKTVPKGYDRDHPYAEYLRLKDIAKYRPMSHADFRDPAWHEQVAADTLLIKPMIDFLNYSIDEDV